MTSIRRIPGLVVVLLLFAVPASAQLVISEFRVRGPSGANDEFIEIMNNSATPHTVAGGGTGYAVAASNGVARCVIPNGTVLPPRGRYLCVNSVGYSLGSYPASDVTTATGDATYTTDIPDNAGIAIFSTSVAANFTMANRLDAVGSTSEANALYKEGTGYPALTPFSIDYAFYRDQCGKAGSITTFGSCPSGGAISDTGNNAVDFIFVDSNGTSAGAGQRLGVPGPQNLSSPLVGAASMPADSLDPCVAASSPPNAVRDFTSDSANNSTFGTLDFRARFTNNTGVPITRLRFRIVDLTTFPAPSAIADLRPRTSTDVVVTVDRAPCGSGTSNVTVQGTTLEQPPSQPNGGGFNSSWSLSDISTATPLANGDGVDVRFLLGVQQTGLYKLGVVVETLPDGVNTLYEFDGCAGSGTCAANLAITKTDGVTTATPGGSVTYTIAASNAGPNHVTGATVTDTFPAVLTSTWTCVGAGGGTCTAAGAGNISDTVNLPVGGSVTYTVSSAIAASATGTLSNTATITAPLGFSDPSPGNNSATDNDTLAPSADLAITKSDGVTTATLGGSVTYTITASNAGPSNAPGVTVADIFPANLTPGTWTCVGAGGGTCTAAGSGNITDTVNLPAGGSVTYTAVGTIVATGALVNTAMVSAPAGVTDPNPGNDSATDTDTVTASFDLAVVKTSTPTYVPGGAITYTIVVTNAGPSVASGFSLADAVPAAITGVTVSCVVSGSGSCGADGSAGNSVSFTNASLAAGAGHALTLTVNGTVSASTSGPIVNTATVAAPGSTDPNLANNSSTATTGSASADIAVALTAGTLTPQIGDALPVVVSATNTSGEPITAATIVVSLPSLIRVKDATPAQGTFDPVAMQWAVGPLVPGASTTLTLALEVADGGPQVLQAARQSSTPDDINAANDVAQAALNIYEPLRTVADLAVGIEGSPIASPGGTARYAIRGVNFGSTNALDEAIAVTTPAGTTFAAVTASSGGVCTAPPVGDPGQIRCLWSGQSVVGGSRDVTLDLRMDAAVPNGEVVSVTAFVSNLTDDPTLGNNSATALTTVTTDPTVADLEVTGAFLPGGLTATVVDIDHRNVAMRFQVRNVGAAPVTSARLQAALIADVAQPALAITGVVLSQGAIDAGAAAWDVGPLAPGATATIDVTATVMRVARLRFELRRIRSAPADGQASNDRAPLTIDVVPPGGGGRYVALGNTDGGPTGEVLVAGGLGETPQVQIYSAAGALEAAFLAYDPRFPGGVRLATCDLDRDGRDDIITAAGMPDGGPHLRIYSRRPNGGIAERASWFTSDPSYGGGVYVACGDVDGDAVPEVVTGTGAEGPATIQIWRPDLGTGTVHELLRGTLADIAPGFGVRVATCDVTGDGRAEILATAVGGSVPLVRIFDVSTPRLVGAFAAARPGEALGLQVACGNILAGGGNEVLVGLDVGGSPLARAFTPEGAFLGEYLAFAPTPGGGVRVAVGEFDGDPAVQEFALASGFGMAPQALVGSARAGVTILLRLAPLEIP